MIILGCDPGEKASGVVLYDSTENRVLLRRIPYDIRGAQQKVRDSGLPPMLAERLSRGQ